MVQPVPAGHLADAQKLEADGIVELFQVRFRSGGHLYLKANDTVTWRGQEYQGIALKLSGVGNASDEEVSRPQLQVMNVDGRYSALVGEGSLDGAEVTRLRVLRDDLVNNRNIAREQRWTVSRVSALNRQFITVELRSSIDGPYLKIPARMFVPPQFPQVSLK